MPDQDCFPASGRICCYFRVTTGLSRTITLVAAMGLGVLVPQAHAFAGLIRWLIMAMLFLVFLQTAFTRSALHRSHAILLAANVVLGFFGWALGWCIGGGDVALAGFFAGITPTATAAPVIVSFLRGRVDYVVAAFLITNLAIATAFPALLPLVAGRSGSAAFGHIFGTVALVVFLPAVGGILLRWLYPKAAAWPAKLRSVSFGMWIVALFLICANATEFVRHRVDAPLGAIVQIAVTSLIVCAVNFSVGYVIGRPDFRREASQALGQKNTTFTIYLALTYASPLIALGPTFYVVWHNLWNSWQLRRVARETKV